MPYLEHHPNDFFPRHLLHDELANPRLVFCRTFDEQINMPDARKYLEKWLCATFYDKPVLNRRFLLLLMGIHEDMLRLLEAAHLLRLEDPERRKASCAEEQVYGPGLPEPELYCSSSNKHYTAWHYLPRYISRKEFANPYRVFDKLCAWKTLPQWRDALQNFFSAAVSGSRIYECQNDENVYLTCRHLLRLVEAAHLVKVREGNGL
ncbi:MAG TPA: hypothetical protein VGM41_03975 [Chitinophagaceae bacterium]|jgi:hypothetical protein